MTVLKLAEQAPGSPTGRKQVYKLLASCWDSAEGSQTGCGGTSPPALPPPALAPSTSGPSPAAAPVFVAVAGLRQGCSQQTSKHPYLLGSSRPFILRGLGSRVSGIRGGGASSEQEGLGYTGTKHSQIFKGLGVGRSRQRPPREAGGGRLHHPQLLSLIWPREQLSGSHGTPEVR